MVIERFLTGPIQVNTYLAYDEESKEGFIVDPGAYCPELTANVKEAGVYIKYIILTHGHGDHIGGIEAHLKDFPDAKIVAYEDEAEMLENPQYNLSVEVCGRPVSIRADIYVKDKETLKVGNLEITFIHTPGHSKGGMCIYTAGHLFSGDTLFRQSIGRSDFYGGDYRALINSIKDSLYVFPDDTKVYPGHMGMTTIGDEKRGNPFV